MFSIIIPCQKPSAYLKECLKHILAQDYADPDETQKSHGASFEIIVLPDENILPPFNPPLIKGGKWGGIKIIPSGNVLPGVKRNLGARAAQGEILAFIDDDAYPSNDWLSQAVKYFKDENIIAIGGPGVTPPEDSFWQQVSGAMYLSWFSGANPDRFWPGKKKFVADWPSMNFLIRKNVFFEAGGFDENYWPGEDSVLCNNLIKSGKKILYAPEVMVYHHRRENLKKHLIQAGNYKRGLFVRLHQKNSLKIKYFLPSLFLLFVLFGWLALFLPAPFNLAYPALWLVYFLAILTALLQIFLKTKKPMVTLASILYIIPTHLIYGWGFIRGLVARK